VSLLIRRVLVPVVGIVVGVCACLSVYVAVRAQRTAEIVWVAAGLTVLGATAIGVVVLRYGRAQSRALVEEFGRVLPRDGTGVQASSIDRVTEATARTVGDVIAQAAKDKGQLLTIIASMTEGLVAVDAQQRILLANRAAEQLLGIKMPDAQGQPVWEHVVVEGVTQAASEVLLTGRPKNFSAGPINGIYLEVMVSRLPAGAGLVIVAHDVTEATRYQRLREDFVANVSHELRTPLAVIKGYVETLRDGAMEDSERAMQYLQTVATHADQLTNLVNDILDLSRLESRDALVEKQRVDVGATLRRVVDLVQPGAARKRQTLTLDVKEDLPGVLGNTEDLARALGNIVENAVKYTREAGWIRVSGSNDQKRVLIVVEDNGIGISKEDLPRIFERFYRSDRSRSREMGGTGLGLSIVKHIVQAHGGTVEVTSRLGAGSKFTVALPAGQ
jgi:two-component system phosphate regulon sensor histidine kinase PhoR